MKTYIIDIDNTICVTEGSNYHNSKPLMDRIKKINKLYDEGHTIIYWTGRGSSSKTNWKFLTIEQLDRWGCKRHQVKFFKPTYDVWVDDKAENVDFFAKLS